MWNLAGRIIDFLFLYFFGVGRAATDRRAPIPINQTIRLQHLHFRPEKSKNHHLTSARLKLTALFTKKIATGQVHLAKTTKLKHAVVEIHFFVLHRMFQNAGFGVRIRQ